MPKGGLIVGASAKKKKINPLNDQNTCALRASVPRTHTMAQLLLLLAERRYV